MRLPDSIRPDRLAHGAEEESTAALSQRVEMTLPYRRYPSLCSMTRFPEAFSGPLQKEHGLPLTYTMTLFTLRFFHAWAPDAYMEGVFANSSFWDRLDAYTDRLPRASLYTLMALTNKSPLYLLPFLRTGHVPPAFVRRARAWRSLYGYFPLYFYLCAKNTPYATFVSDVLPSMTAPDLENAMRRMAEDMDRLLENAPSLDHPLVVYRGVKDTDHVSRMRTWTDPAFVSTTLHPLHAFSYKNPTGACCVQRLLLPVSVKVLLLQGLSNFKNEWEVLLPRNLRFRIVREKEVQVPTEGQWEIPHPQRYQTVRLQEVRVYAEK